VDAQSLQQFVSDSPWSEAAVWTAIRREIVPHLEPIESWVVDETGWLKQGNIRLASPINIAARLESRRTARSALKWWSVMVGWRRTSV